MPDPDKEIWRKTAEKDPELFKAIGPYCPYEVASTGWRITIYARCSDEALIFAGPQVFDVTAVSAADGRHLWTYHAARNPHVLVRDDGVYLIGAGGLNGDTHKLDPFSAKIMASYNNSRTSCTRATGCADSIFFRGGGDGTLRLETATNHTQWFSPMRPSCFVGTVVASGHLYWIPWECDCNLQMFGVLSCGPADTVKSGESTDTSERLETCGGTAAAVAPWESSPADWPTYRANNARTAATPVEIPESVSLLWKFTPDSAFEPTAPVTRPLVRVTGIGRGTDAMRMADRPHVDYNTFMSDYATEGERSSDETKRYYRNLWDHGTRYPGIHSFRAGRTAGNMAWKHAGISDPLKELDFVELHDAYTSSELQTYEDLGLCRYGEGGAFAESGKAFMPGIDYGLKLKDKTECAVNPSGGLIACGHPVGATGLIRACSPSGSCRAASPSISATLPCRFETPAGALSIATPGLARMSRSPCWSAWAELGRKDKAIDEQAT